MTTIANNQFVFEAITDINSREAKHAAALLTEDLIDLKAFCSLTDTDSLRNLASLLNLFYRAGQPVISDSDYDHIVLAELAERDPNDAFLNTVEDEGESGQAEGKIVTLPARMLSTNKAYLKKDITAWLGRIEKAAEEVGVQHNDIQLRVTPKLDGFASYDDGQSMYTRGNGIRGTDISYILANGLKTYNNAWRGLGAGEIVVDPAYFEENLSGQFKNTRNVISGVLREKPVASVKKAIVEGGVVFVPFSTLANITCSIPVFCAQYDAIIAEVKSFVAFDIDGVIVEVTNSQIKEHMGATQKAHRWMIALKENEAPVQINVLSVTPQTSRKGRVVPVLELEPTKVSGVTVSRVTAHNYTHIKEKQIGEGTIINLVRSGLVIPIIVGIVKQTQADMPTHCPSCGEALEWGNEADGTEMDLMCNNTEACPAQAYKRLLHWFETLENVNGFGPSTIQTLSKDGSISIVDIYNMTKEDYINKGFGEKTAENLKFEANRSKSEPVEDYRFLAAFGIRTLGRSMSEKILSKHNMDDLFSLTEEDFIKIDKVGAIKAQCIYKGLQHIKEAYDILKPDFNLIITPLDSERIEVSSPIAGKTIVFTGTMLQNSRSDMTKQAKSLGAIVGSGVSSNTDILVTGLKVGSVKIAAAQKNGTTVMNEEEYLALIQ